MTAQDITLRVIDALNGANIPHLLVGSFSSNYYGIPRSTEDADFVVQLEVNSVENLLRQLGPDFVIDAQMSFETNTGTFKQELRWNCLDYRVIRTIGSGGSGENQSIFMAVKRFSQQLKTSL